MPQMTFVGTGEACDPELPNTSLLYRGGKSLLMDCGYGVPHALWRLSIDPELLDGIWISHRHADHTFGLPGLLLWLHESGRTEPLRILGGAGTSNWLLALLEMAYPGLFAKRGAFEIEVEEVLPGTPYVWGELTLNSALSTHSLPNLALRIDDGGASACYSGDGALSAASRELFANTGLLVHECYAPVSVMPTHADAESLLPFAEGAGIETLCLLHFARAAKQPLRQLVDAYDGPLRLMAPRPGDSVELA